MLSHCTSSNLDNRVNNVEHTWLFSNVEYFKFLLKSNYTYYLYKVLMLRFPGLNLLDRAFSATCKFT